MILSAPLDARDVRARGDFVAIAGRYTRLRRAGRQFVGLCPFHREWHPSFYLHPQKKVFYCFGCQVGGDLFDFIMRIEGCDFPGALKVAAAFSGAVDSAGEVPFARRHTARQESFAEAAARVLASLPAPGFVPSCARCSVPMVFSWYRGNRFGGAYYCKPCSVFFGPKELRAKLLVERGAVCQWCYRTDRSVQMHHLSKRGNQYEPASIVLFCARCHVDFRKVLALDKLFKRRSRKGPERSEGPPSSIGGKPEPRPRPMLGCEWPSLECAAESGIYTPTNNFQGARRGRC